MTWGTWVLSGSHGYTLLQGTQKNRKSHSILCKRDKKVLRVTFNTGLPEAKPSHLEREAMLGWVGVRRLSGPSIPPHPGQQGAGLLHVR